MILQDINQGSIKISDAGKKTYEAARESVSHLRPRTSKGFLLEVEREIREAEQSTDKQIILAEAKQICELNWALVLPFFNAAKNIPADDNLIIKCSNLAQQLAVHDIDSAVTFLNRIPVALEKKTKKRYGRLSRHILLRHQKQTADIRSTDGVFSLIRQFALQPFRSTRLKVLSNTATVSAYS
jgi:hypothetical protein